MFKKGVNMLELYVMESCPYCKKVMSFLDENNVSYSKMDISNRENYDALLNLGGMEQVPFLNDTENNVKMYESDDIIKYVSKL
jgi:glutaredoxin